MTLTSATTPTQKLILIPSPIRKRSTSLFQEIVHGGKHPDLPTALPSTVAKTTTSVWTTHPRVTCYRDIGETTVVDLFHDELRRIMPGDAPYEYDQDWFKEVDAKLLLAPVEVFEETCQTSMSRPLSTDVRSKPVPYVPVDDDDDESIGGWVCVHPLSHREENPFNVISVGVLHSQCVESLRPGLTTARDHTPPITSTNSFPCTCVWTTAL